MDSNKRIMWLFVFLGGTLGSYAPLLWGDSQFSFASVLGSALGGILGIWIGFKLTQ